MKKVSKNHLISGGELSIQAIILGFFFLNFFGFNTSGYLTCLTVAVLIFITRDVLISFISIVLSIGILSLLAEIEFLTQFIIKKPVTEILLLNVLISLLLALLFKKHLKITLKIKFHETVILLFLVAIQKIIFDRINSQSLSDSLRFLVYSGEDNVSWLNGLASGFESDGNHIFEVPVGSDVKSLTHLCLIFFRQISWLGLDSQSVTANALILQKFYLMIIFVILIIVGTSTFRIINSFNSNLLGGYLFSGLNIFSIYLCLASFGMFGHLTPILSLLYLYASIFFSLIFKPSNADKYKMAIYTSVPVILLISAKNAWYPVAPAVYLTLAVMIFYAMQNRKIKKFVFPKFIKLFRFSLVALALIVLLLSSRIIDSLTTNIAYFVRLLHWPGGSLSPGIFHLFFLVAILMIYFLQPKFLPEKFSSDFMKILSISFGIYYGLILIFSLITSPFTIDYAGQKFGLLITSLFLPIGLVLIFNFFMKYKNNFETSIAAFFTSTFFVIFAGSPTVSQDTAWMQPGYPLAVLNRIQNEDTSFWESKLITKIDENSDKKLVLCFEKLVEIPDVTQSCSRYAMGLQGVFYDDFSQYWIQVNWNNTSENEFLGRAPSDFNTKYEILLFDELKSAQKENAPLNVVYELVLNPTKP